MADKIKLEILGLSSSQSQSGSFALVLGEVGGNRRLPIIIGMFEAQAIAIEIEKMQRQNEELKAKVDRVQEGITTMEEKLNMVKMVCEQDMKVKNGRNVWC